MLTLSEVAEQLRLDPETVRLKLVSGEIQGFKGKGRTSPWRIPETSLASYIEQQTPSPAAS